MQKDVPGFIANRMQHALWREAISIVERASPTPPPWTRLCALLRPAAAPVGPHGERRHGGHRPHLQHPRLHSKRTWRILHEPSPLLKKLRDEGKIGFKTGGLPDLDPGQIEQSKEGLNDYLVDMLYGKVTPASSHPRLF